MDKRTCKLWKPEDGLQVQPYTSTTPAATSALTGTRFRKTQRNEGYLCARCYLPCFTLPGPEQERGLEKRRVNLSRGESRV